MVHKPNSVVCRPNKIIKAAPTAAPEETPKIYGSANGFRSTPSYHALAIDKLAPTNIAKTTLVIRIFMIIYYEDSAQSPVNEIPKPGICCNKIPHTCERGSFAVPLDKPTITQKRISI